MDQMSIAAATLDDAMRWVFSDIFEHGEPVVSTKGPNREVFGRFIQIANPRARLSWTESRGKPLSCLGELCWFLSGSADTDFISYYLNRYREFDEGGRVFGAYGPRLHDWRGLNQLKTIRSLLRARPLTRQAVIQLFDAGDIVEKHKDVPCTCTLQFAIRRNRLHLLAQMRSNDAYIGFPHDVFCFTMLQELIARELGLDLGTYQHVVGSFHLYDADSEKAKRFLNEGWQSTEDPMPAMPDGDPWTSVEWLLSAEREIRLRGHFEEGTQDAVDSYWVDLVRLLKIYRCRTTNDSVGIEALRSRINPAYLPLIDRPLIAN